jgi:hypothetical protein
MTTRRFAVVSLALAVALGLPARRPALAQIPDGLYFGQTPPGETPEVFAPGVISLSNRYEYSIAFSPDLTECAFGITNNTWGVFNVYYTTMASDSSWSTPVVAPFKGTGDALSVVFTPDNQAVWFASHRPVFPANLWMSERDGMGGWLAPVKVASPVNSSANEYAPAFSASGVLYFVSYRIGGQGSADIYRAEPVGGAYPVIENIGGPVNAASLDSTPFIAPDESYLLFESDRAGGFGQHDIYMSWALPGGGWSEPLNVGSAINTPDIEDGPCITPDGKYLFFNRRAAFTTPEQTELWWVDVSALPSKPTAVAPDPGPGAGGTAAARTVPNPFHPSTRIEYTLPLPGFVTIEVLDVRGRVVARFVERRQEAGPHVETLPASRTRGLPAGTYLYRLVVDGRSLATGKMALVK